MPEVADSGFPRTGASALKESANLLFGKCFAENCIKMKEIGPRDPPIEVCMILIA